MADRSYHLNTKFCDELTQLVHIPVLSTCAVGIVAKWSSHTKDRSQREENHRIVPCRVSGAFDHDRRMVLGKFRFSSEKPRNPMPWDCAFIWEKRRASQHFIVQFLSYPILSYAGNDIKRLVDFILVHQEQQVSDVIVLQTPPGHELHADLKGLSKRHQGAGKG